MNTVAQRFTQHWKERQFPQQGTLLLALSGGLDSMALAALLLQSGLRFAAAHCNFSLRGEDAEQDAAFVAAWCEANGVPFHLIRFDTQAEAQLRGQSIQMAARELRYEWFEALRRTHGYTAILTAHHADDVTETMLINLCRGTGIAGLHGIPERHGHLIRPLLFAQRAELAAFAKESELSWREDASNAEDKYLRNAMRLHVLPTLEALLPGAALRIAKTAGRLHAAELIYRKELNRRLTRLIEHRGNDIYVPVRLLEKQEALPTVAFELFTPFGFSPEQTQQILNLLHAESGRQVMSSSHRVVRHRDFLVVSSIAPDHAGLIYVSTLPASLDTPDGSFHLEWITEVPDLPNDPHTAVLDGDALTLPLVLRRRREGDYFYPLGMGMKKKKLKRFLIDLKIPLHEKERIWLLEHDRRILWVAGLRIDERFKWRPATRRVLKITFHPKA
jgi:tRNA(Ile)-lysidine synthase